jgi:hypothetical protein
MQGVIVILRLQDIHINGDILSIRRYRRLLSIKYAIGSGTRVFSRHKGKLRETRLLRD